MPNTRQLIQQEGFSLLPPSSKGIGRHRSAKKKCNNALTQRIQPENINFFSQANLSSGHMLQTNIDIS